MDFIKRLFNYDHQSQRLWCPKRVTCAIPDYRGPFASIQCFSPIYKTLICVDHLQGYYQNWWVPSCTKCLSQAVLDDFISSTGFYCCIGRAYRRHLIWPPSIRTQITRAFKCHLLCWIITYFLRSTKRLEFLSSVVPLMKWSLCYWISALNYLHRESSITSEALTKKTEQR